MILGNDMPILYVNNFSLEEASIRGKIKIVQYLIKNGYDVHKNNEITLKEASENGNFAFKIACRNRHHDIAKCLLGNGQTLTPKNIGVLSLNKKRTSP
ncbi:hypothetical protein BB558_006478, partial [Smittium angustum]